MNHHNPFDPSLHKQLRAIADPKPYEPKVSVVWSTPEPEKYLAYIARISNPNASPDDPYTKLIRYMIDHSHWSPFEMVNVCVELRDVPRDITRQILRHSSSVQEFSQRYAEPTPDMYVTRECRMQHPTNRQQSLEVDDIDDAIWWSERQTEMTWAAVSVYTEARQRGIAKEVARVVLPEGLTLSHMHINFNLRNLLFYLNSRLDRNMVQKEHVMVAEQIFLATKDLFPHTFDAFFAEEPEAETSGDPVAS